jgi:pyruvate dehydrogenase E1 component subunit alpha
MAKTTREAANRARAGEGPTFIDALTYRYKGHSISDPGKYRHKEELETAIRNDPILVYQNVLKERGWIDQEAIDRMLESVKEEVEESIEFAEQCDPPAMETLYEDITMSPFIPQE